MTGEATIAPTTKSVDKQFEDNFTDLKKSMEAELKLRMSLMQREIDYLKANQRRSEVPDTFLGPREPFVKSFDDHLFENKMTLQQHLDKAYDSLANASFTGEKRPSLQGMQKSLSDRKAMEDARTPYKTKYQELQKSFNDPDKYAAMAKSLLGESGTPGAPGAWYYLLEENLSREVQRIMLSNEDASALQSIPTAITTNIIPEMGRLKTYGVGYGKHTMGFAEGRSAVFGGGQLMDRLSHTLVQRGVRAAVTEMLIANKQKLVDRNPLALERELRILEYNLGLNHQLLYGDEDINKSGTTILEMDGLLKQMEDTSTGYAAHILDWNAQAYDSTHNPLDIFRQVAQNLIFNGHIPGGVITGKYSVLIDYGAANEISTYIDDKQRVMVEKYEQAALMYGQNFSGFVTDLGTFRFKRSKTLHLTANDTWTADADVSNHAITWPHAATDCTAIASATTTQPKSTPVGAYRYRVSAVNDHGESDVSDAFVTTSDGTTPDPVGASEIVTISIPYDAAFAGGTVGGYVVSPCRYFLLYRANAGETDDSDMKCIAKIPINGTSTTTYVDYNQKIPGCTDMFFVSNNPMDIAHTRLTPEFEIPLYDIDYGSTRQWMIMSIGGLTTWAPMRQFIVRNVPGFSAT